LKPARAAVDQAGRKGSRTAAGEVADDAVLADRRVYLETGGREDHPEAAGVQGNHEARAYPVLVDICGDLQTRLLVAARHDNTLG